jgi:hypothetical protein
MKRRATISGLVALLLAGLGLCVPSASALAEAAGPRTMLAQLRADGPGFESYRGPKTFGGPSAETMSRRQPLPDKQIWAVAQARVPGRIVSAHLRGTIYSFRIISQRGNIVDVEVDRFQGRVVSVRGGP